MSLPPIILISKATLTTEGSACICRIASHHAFCVIDQSRLIPLLVIAPVSINDCRAVSSFAVLDVAGSVIFEIENGRVRDFFERRL